MVGIRVGALVGVRVGALVGVRVGALVGTRVGAFVGESVGSLSHPTPASQYDLPHALAPVSMVQLSLEGSLMQK